MRWGYALVTAPKEEPITLGEAKAHLRVTDTDSDAYIDSLIVAARQVLDGPRGRLERALLAQTWDLTLDAFPTAGEPLLLPLSPVTSVDSVKYLDADGAQQTLAPSTYRLDLSQEPERLTLDYGQTWPATRAVTAAVTVRVTAGWANASAVPQPLKLGLCWLVAHYFEHREPVITGTIATEIPMHVEAALRQYRVPRYR